MRRERKVACFPLKTGNASEIALTRDIFRYILGMTVYKNVFCAGAALAVFSLSATVAVAAPLMNQLGFFPDAEKTVVYPGEGSDALEVRDMKGKTVLKVDAPKASEWEYSGEKVQAFDISAVKKPGKYRLFRGGDYVGDPLTVKKNVYGDLVDYINPDYGFSTLTGSANTRYCKTTDWARARGAYYYSSNGYYWTRSPSSYYPYYAWDIDFDGSPDHDYVDFTSGSVRPGLSITVA